MQTDEQMTISLTLLLVSIAQVETGNNPHAIGKLGERSAYQVSEAVWAQHAKHGEPFALASTNAQLAEHVATEHLIYLTREMERAGVPISVENLAYAWNSGPAAAIRGILHGQKFKPNGFVKRVANIYAEEAAKVKPDIPAHLL
jgi:hypothetical protein